MDIVVVGSIAFDTVVTQGRTIKDALGGSALYFSASASLFAPVHMVGVVGEDFPMEELAFLKLRGVNIDGIETVKGGKTFRWSGEYEIDMNKRKTTDLELNVFEDFNPILNNEGRKAEIVFLGNIDPDLQLKVLEQIENPRFIAADTIECYLVDKPERFSELLKKINLLLINDSEAQLFTGKHNIVSAARALLEYGPEYIIVKKGEHGSLLVSKDNFFTVPAFPVENVIDPTGAGDTYAGGVIGYIAQKQSWDVQTLKKAVVYGGLTASFLVEGFSLEKVKDLTFMKIEERFKAFRSMTVY